MKRWILMVVLGLLAHGLGAQLPRCCARDGSPPRYEHEWRWWQQNARYMRTVVLDCDPSRGDYSTFAGAMTALASETRDAATQWTLLVMPCTYTLPRGTTIPSWVNVSCVGSATSLDASWGDNSPCTLSVDSGTGDALLMGDSSLSGFLVESLVSCGTTNCGLVDWSTGGFVALRDVTLHATTPGWIGIRFDSTTSDRLVLEDVQAVMEGGDAESRGLVFSSAGPGWVRGLALTTAGNGGAGDVALTHSGTGDLRMTGLSIEEFWGTQISHTGGGDLAVSGVTSDAALITPNRASAPACDRAGKQYSDTTAPGALCWCDGTSWVVVAGAGGCV